MERDRKNEMIKRIFFVIGFLILIYVMYGIISTKHSVSNAAKMSEFKSEFISDFYKFKSIESDSSLKLIGLQFFIEIPTYSCKSCKKIFKFINQQKIHCQINIVTSCKSNYIYNQLKKIQSGYNDNLHIYISTELSILNSQIFSNGIFLFTTRNNTIDYISVLEKYKKELEVEKQISLLCADKA